MKDIYKHIINAQVASDGGKGIDEIKNLAPKIWKQGYKVKDREIMRAINLIKNGNGYDVKFSVKRDYYSKTMGQCYIVYFTFGNKKQASFHSYNDELCNYVATDVHIVRWDRDSSRDTILYLEETYG